MNINLPLAGKIIGSCAFSVASVISVINFKPPEGVENTTQEGVVIPESETTTADHPSEEETTQVTTQVENSEEESATSTQNSPEKPAASTTQKTAAKAQSAQQVATQPAKTTQTTTAQTTQNRYTSVYDFEHAMLGVCPQNVPSGVWPDKLRPIVSLGYRPEEKYGGTSRDIEFLIDIYWSAYKQGTQAAIQTFDGKTFDANYGSGAGSTIFTINFSNNTVTYKLPSFYTPNDKQWVKSTAQRGQAHLQSISSQFKAKCGY